jgi:hypothetical protein
MAMLRGELDWVVMKCLEKPRERRYETANGLARDIQRYLADEPVEARPPSAGYRLGKFVKRHKTGAIAASLVLLALLAGVAGTTYGLLRAELRRKEAESAQKAEAEQRALAESERDKARAAENQTGIERDKARAAEAQARAINDFLTQDLLTQAEPANNAAEDHVTLLEVLDRAADKVGGRFADRPELESGLRATIANTYHGLASWEKAEAQRRALLEAARKRNPQSAEFYGALSQLAHILRHRGRRGAEVLKSAVAAAEGLERTRGPDHPDTVSANSNLALAYLDDGKVREAVALQERVRDAQISRLGPDHPDTLRALNNLAAAYKAAGRLPETIALFERVRDANIAQRGKDHPDTLTALDNLASAYHADGRLADAIALGERVRDAQIAKLGPEHPETLATLDNLASAYHADRRLCEAIALYEQVRAARIAKLGPDHPDTLKVLANLATAYRSAGRFPEAITLFERMRGVMIAKLGPDHPDTLTALANLAVAYQAAGRLPEAIALLERVRDGMIAALGPDHPDTLTTLGFLAAAYQAAGRLPEAIALFERVRDAKIAGLGPDHPATLSTLDDLASSYRAATRFPEAIALLERIRDARIAKRGPDHRDTLTTLNNIAATYWLAKQRDRSVPLFEDLLKRREAKLGRQHPDTQLTLANLGVNYKDVGRLKEATPLLEEAYRGSGQFPKLRWVGGPLLDVYVKTGRPIETANLVEELVADTRKTLPKESPQLANSLAQFSLTLLQVKAYAEAEPLLRECVGIREKTEYDRWSTFSAKSMLGGALLGQKKYADAEPLLVSGYEGMKRREATIPPPARDRLTEALERLVELYEATNKPDGAARVRKELEGRRESTKPAEKKP